MSSADVTRYLTGDLFAGRTIFVTGGSSGINLAIAKSFARLGGSLALCGRTKAKLDAAADEIRALGAKVETYVADVRDRDVLGRAIDDAGSALGPVDVLVCGAAGTFIAPAQNISSNGFRTVVEIDLLGSFHAAHAAFDQLKETRGNIVFVSGGQSMTLIVGQAHVGAAKAGVDSLMRHLAVEWAPFGIRSNAIFPGPVEGSEGMRRLAYDEVATRAWTQSIPLGRFAGSDEVASAAVVLASPLASYINGTELMVDGGMHLTGTALVNVGFTQAIEAMEKQDSKEGQH